MTGTDTFLAAPITAGDGADLDFDTIEGVIDVDGAISLGEDAFLTFSSGADLSLGADITWGAGSEVDAFATNDITIAGALSGPTGDLEIGAEGTITPDGRSTSAPSP